VQQHFEDGNPKGTSCQRRARGQTIPDDALDMRRQASIRLAQKIIDPAVFQTVENISRHRWTWEAGKEALEIRTRGGR
jgi:hypothetical protein